ncbi:OmpA family protein [Flavobacteriaceae bacterium Ap0902]|nr:OmpA family protein [Flavobacteriaceae bacterium Ap0902]
MKKILFALSLIALVSCKFDQNGNKGVLPETDDNHTEVTPHAPSTETDETVSSENTQLDEHGNFIYSVGDLTTITLPDGKTLEVGMNSTENKLYNMLADAGYEVNQEDKTQGWITLDRVYFETGSDGLTANSITQIDNIVNILNAFPDAHVKFGGYTDNTGSQEINQPLSEGRAKTVMNNIINDGISADRLEAEGYGSEHPVCPENDTQLCKAQNRRVDIRITEK